MLADVEDESVVHDEAFALRLHDVEIVALCVGCWVADEEVVRWVLADVRDRQGESESVWVVFDAVHHTTFASVDLEYSLSVIAWWHCFDGKTFPTSGPFCLCKCGFADDLAGLEEVAVGIACKGAAFGLGNHFNVFRNVELEVCHLEVLQVKTAGVVITKLDVVTEVRRPRDRQMHESLMIHGRDNMLLLGKKWHVSVADLCGPGEEVPVLGDLGAGAAVQSALGMSWASQSAVHDTPLAIDDDGVPPMVRAGHALHV